MADKAVNDARHEVLVDNTAQTVSKHLNKLFQEEARFRSRWVWELLQNARDASPDEGVNVWLVQEPGNVVFKHSGVPFTHKSIAHLIYHGSTKYDLSDPGAIGQFGTGFLTTHLISRTVSIRGRTVDGKRFSFLLDRRGTTADELKTAMDHSWDAFTESLSEDSVEDTDGFTTEYKYPLTVEIMNVVEEGIADLIANATYLFEFNNRIRSLRIEQATGSTYLERKVYEPLDQGARRLQVEERKSADEALLRYVAALGNDETSVAVELKHTGGRWSVTQQDNTPRIFVAFPLTGTRNFCLPTVINNEKFQPREDRDTLVLVPNRDGKHQNMLRMEEACSLVAQFSVLAAREGWDGAAMLTRLNPLCPWEWVDLDWFRCLVGERFIQPVRSAQIMATVNSTMIAPSEGMIPLSSDPVLCRDLWDIAVQVREIAALLPRRTEAHVWAENLLSWQPFFSESVDHLEESLTISKFSERVSKWKTVLEVQKQLVETTDAIEWLNRLHAHISSCGSSLLFEQERLIPSQNGELKKITELRRDPGIDEELKDIAQSLGLPVRDDLVDQRILLKECLELQPKPQSEVLSAAIQRVKDKSKAKVVDATFKATAVRLFVWLIRHGETDKLDGLPVVTRGTAGEDAAVLTLFRDPDKVDDRPLAPIGCWPEPVRRVENLFPKRQTLCDDYRDALSEDTLWEKVAEEGYVRLGPLYTTRRRSIPFIADEPLPVSEKDKKLKHRTKEAVNVSALAFYEKDEVGLDSVRRSKIRAVNLLLFLANYVLEVDSEALSTMEADCECGLKHNYYRAAWLVPMWDRQWVPLGEGKQSSATAETIAQLFGDREEDLRYLTAGKGRKLLEALKISLADLSLRAMAPDEDTRLSLIDALTDIVHAADNDAEKVKLVAEEIKNSPGLLDEIREHRDRREKVRRNQSMGTEVEKLLEKALRGYGLKVNRTGIGSDYEIEEDFLLEAKEVLLSIESGHRSLLVEIKSSLGKVSRMTVTQAKMAVDNKDRFLLCMVRLDSPDVTSEIVRDRCRFVTDIGSQLQPVWSEYQRYQETRDAVCTRVGEVELIVHDSEVRFAVGDGAWSGGLPIDEAVKYILKCLGR